MINSKNDLKRILAYIDVCVFLHNLLVKSQVPEDWEDDDFSDIDDPTHVPPLDDNDELNRAVLAGKPKDWPRMQLLNYFDEVPIAE
jgi:hypothetical protein